MRLIILVIIITSLLSSCASYDKKEFKSELILINESNLAILNGKYESRPFYYFGKQDGMNQADSLKKLEILGIYERLQNKSMQYDLPEVLDYQLANLKFDDRKLVYELIRNDSIIKKDSIDFKIKKGMIKLKNSFYKCEGLPFLLGGCRNGRVRIGISKKNNLIINKSYDQYGALLIIIGAGVNSNTTYEYKRIK